MCHSFASAATWSRSNETLNIAHSVFAAWELYVFFSISWDCLSSNFSHTLLSSVKTNPAILLVHWFFFLFNHDFSLVSFCPALVFSSQQWQEHAGWVQKTDNGSRKGSFLLFSAPLVSPLHVTYRFRLQQFLLWIENHIDLPLHLPSSLLEQHLKCANAMTNHLLWAVDSLMPDPLDWTHTSSYGKAVFTSQPYLSVGLLFYTSTAWVCTQVKNLELHISAHPHIMVHPGAAEKQSQGCVRG